MREILPNFESMYKTSQLAKVCELASFWHSVEVGESYKTIPDVDDDVGDITPTCREDTFPRLFGAIPGGTVIGPATEVHVVQLLGNHGQ